MDLSQNFKQRYEKLNPAQKQAVDTIDGPVLVIAGPGSGKTEILSLSVANKLLKTDTLPSSILCLTFTDAAAVNMRKRLARLIGPEAYKVAIHTFHSFGTEVINQNPEYFYQGANYTPADQLIQIQIMEEVFESFDHNASINSYHPSQGYTYLREALTKISELKKGGLSPEDFAAMIEQNAKFIEIFNPNLREAFQSRVSKKTLGILTNLLGKIQAMPDGELKHAITESLNSALQDAQVAGSTKPITQWKNDNTSKDKDGNTILKDAANLEKHRELAIAYGKYQKTLHDRGYFDFSDMILDVIEQTKKHPDLKYNLQEKYQYVLVDEFQDTSGAQMKLMEMLLDAEVNEGRPNILAVGDDDQSIFKFQGAKLDNILGFNKKYRDPEIVVLTNNYRSTQNILDLARKVIVQSDERLETKLPEVIKELKAAAQTGEGQITEQDFPTNLHEYSWVANEITKLIKQGHDPQEIAIIAPKHRLLREVAKTLDFHEIPISYEQQKDLLQEPHIREIIQIAKFINTIISSNQTQADEYLPEILSYDFWEISKLDVWKISLTANKQRQNWLETMMEYENPKIQEIAKFFIELAGQKDSLTAEEFLDKIIGSSEVGQYTSPYKHYYFDKKSEGYIALLSGLESFFSTIRSYHSKAGINISDFLEFIELNEKHNIQIPLTQNYSSQAASVQLMTAHKSKGLEFQTVFIISCQDDVWVRRNNFNKLKLPSNLNLSPEAETIDDQLRLFYVALTRAKRQIYLTSHNFLDNGREQSKIRFLQDSETEKSGGVMPQKVQEMKDTHAKQHNLEKLIELKHNIGKHQISSPEDKDLLKERVQDYKLSVTHLNNFLNLIDGGPQRFLEHNLLRFPQRQSVASAYGSAVHNALNRLQKRYKLKNEQPSPEFLIQSFVDSLKLMRLNERDHQKLEKKGQEQLSEYYKDRIQHFNPKDYAEFNFDSQSVIIGHAHLTGKIDKMHIDEHSISVLDYKTGKPLRNWDGRYDYEKLKSWQYKNQLIFYKLLVENSRDFRNKYKVHTGTLEFVEAKDPNERFLNFEISEHESNEMSQLVQKVYGKISNLDFPDTSQYEQNMYGIMCFIEDLLTDKI